MCDSNSRLKRWPKLSAEKFAYSKERTSYATCVPCFFRLVAFRTSYAIRVACSFLSFRLIALSKNELCFLCRVLVLTRRFKNELPCLFRLVAFRTSYAIRVACSFLSFRLIALSKNELCFLCRVLVFTHRFKNDLCYMCTVLFSTHGLN